MTPRDEGAAGLLGRAILACFVLVAALGAAVAFAHGSTMVTLYHSGRIEYQDGTDWVAFEKPTMHLPQGDTHFRFSESYETTISVGAPRVSKLVNVLVLTAHDGTPLSGGTGRGGYGSSHSTWHVSGATDTGGVLLDIRDAGAQPGTMSYEMNFAGTTSAQTQDVSENSIFVFQTVLITLRLETCAGAPLDGGRARYGAGSTYSSWWFPGHTGDSAPGETEGEFLPGGTYSFEMHYQSTTDQSMDVVIPGMNHTLLWETTHVTLYYSGAISYGGGAGDTSWFTKPSMELLAGTYRFHFRGGARVDLTISGCSMSKAVNVLTLKDGVNPVSGATARGGFGGEFTEWHVFGATDADGVLVDIVSIGQQPGDMSYEMCRDKATLVKTQNVATNSIFAFQLDELEPPYCSVGFVGELEFSSGNLAKAQNPLHTDDVHTEPLGFFANTNVPEGCSFTLTFTGFAGDHKTLPTRMSYSFGGENSVVEAASGSVMLVAPQGENEGWLHLTVTRDGYRDPAGTYVATVSITCNEVF